MIKKRDYRTKIEKKFNYSPTTPMMDTLSNLDLLINDNQLWNKKIVVFGINAYTERVLSILDKEGIKVDCILDNDINKQDSSINGIKVIKPEELQHERKDVIILISSTYFDEMCDQLLHLGWDRKNNIIRLAIFNSTQVHITMNDTVMFTVKLFKVYIFSKIYTNLFCFQKKIFLAPVFGLGDYYYIFGYLKDYCRLEKNDNFIVLCLTEIGVRIGKTFDISQHKLKKVSSKTMDMLIEYCNVFGEEDTGIKILHWARRKGEVLTEIHRNCKTFSVPFNKTYEYIVFGKELSFVYPSKNIGQERINNVFKNQHLIVGKTVVIAPDSNTIVNIPLSFWSKLIKELKNKGMCVCTNISSEGADALDGTIGVFMPLEAMIGFCDKAGFFVGSRSGLCDIVCGGDCTKVILYNDSLRLNNVEDVFSFKSMEIGRNIIEIRYSEKEEDETVIKVLQMMGL